MAGGMRGVPGEVQNDLADIRLKEKAFYDSPNVLNAPPITLLFFCHILELLIRLITGTLSQNVRLQKWFIQRRVKLQTKGKLQNQFTKSDV